MYWSHHFSGGSSNPSSNFSTPYNTINRPKDGQGYDDTTLSVRNRGYPPNSHMAGSDPRLYQGHSNPALTQEQPGMIASCSCTLDFFFRRKVLVFFLFLHENIHCGYSSEATRQGATDEYPQYKFPWRDWTKYHLVTPSYLELCFRFSLHCIVFIYQYMYM